MQPDHLGKLATQVLVVKGSEVDTTAFITLDVYGVVADVTFEATNEPK